jgi:hypothetical protein
MARDDTVRQRPAGQERLHVDPASMELAPGRETKLLVATFVQTSPTSMTPVVPDVSFESSAPSVASVTREDVATARVLARSLGTAVITVRSRRERANVATIPVTVKSAPQGNEQGLVMTAAAALVPTASARSSGTTLGPMELNVSAKIVNPTSGVRDIWLSPCTWIRIFPTPRDTGNPLADIPRARCMGGPRHVVLEPGDSSILTAEGFRLTGSEDTLPNGRVYVFAAVDRVRDLVNVPAGPIDISSPNAGLSFLASTSVVGANADTVRTRVTFRNTNALPVRLEYGACSLDVLAYRTAERNGRPAWDSRLRSAGKGVVYGCPAYLAVDAVAPGEAKSPPQFNAAYAVREILGDSLPDGRYYFMARIRLNWRRTSQPAGDAEIRR